MDIQEDQLEILVQLEQPDPKLQQDLPGLAVIWVQQERLDLKLPLAQQDLLELMVLLEQTEFKEQLDHKEIRV
jgi:hypothetical protein